MAVFCIFTILFILFNFGLTSQPVLLNPLNGQHLRVIWPLWEGNPKGLTGPLKGGVILDYLSSRFNFTFEMIRVTEDYLETPIKGKGLFNFLENQQCDLLLQDVTPSSRRLGIVDMTLPWNFGFITFLIPVPDNTANISAVVKPFQWPVWLSLAVSIVFVIVTLNPFQQLFHSKPIWAGIRESDNNESRKFSSPYLYVFGNLLSQGVSCKSIRLSFRIVAGTWALATFFFVQAYTSILFTYVMTPVSSPLINSVYDVIEKPEINLYIKKGEELDFAFSNASNSYNENEIFKKLRKKLDFVSNSRCTRKSECINLIRPGSRNVYLDSIYFQMDAIKENFKSTGKCNLQLSRDGFLNFISTIALSKNSRYTKTISQGLLELQEIGLITYWDSWFRPMPLQCMKNLKSSEKKSRLETQKPSPISFKNLTGAFIVLFVGVSLSLLAFINEIIISALVTASAKKKPIESRISDVQDVPERL